ncbi:MAG: ATP-binding cassette domain-containing protein [Acutalibacteraceae bacterium]
MLETKNLVKIYKPKKGVPVTALNKVSIKFPERGMVFLLGKSGSGKSTLLNVLGGLDNYNGGEIIIKGVSSKAFKQKHFDSYRNTYVGFIFQEYNVLDEFSVGANIALAIELQNRRATNEEINEILKAVDMEGYGNRKPNELSGGQKQRVAIARALVKKPEIIMADEPTGALDSNTGKQIFDTLKKLSKEKLVIVVSHDREFAETYADRIIELADGEVISDLEVNREQPENEPEENTGIKYDGYNIELAAGYRLTEEDYKAINDYLDSLETGKVNLSIARKSEAHKKFVPTDSSKIKTQDGSSFKLIKSKLPIRNAVKIGAGALKHKKFRLVMTIFLSCISFGLFGLADTFGSYNHIAACTNSLYDTGYQYVAAAKSKKVKQGNSSYWRDYGYKLSENDLSDFKKNTGVKMHPVYTPLDADLSFAYHIDASVELTKTHYNIFNPVFYGFAEINDTIMKDMEFKLLAGNLPNGAKDEIAVSEYAFEIFKKAKYSDGSTVNDAEGMPIKKYTDIKNYSDLIGKTLTVGGKKYTITAVIDTNFHLDRYLPLLEEKEYTSQAQQIIDYALYSEFNVASQYSFSGLIMTGEGYLDKLIAERPNIAEITEGYLSFNAEDFLIDSNYLARLSDMKNQKIIWFDGEKTKLGEKELVVTANAVQRFKDDSFSTNDIISTLKSGELSAYKTLFSNRDDNFEPEPGYKVVGIIEIDENFSIPATVVCSDEIYSQFVDVGDNFYNFAVGEMPESKTDIKNLVSYCYREDQNVRYKIQNSTTWELDTINDVLKTLSKVFFYISIGFAAFAALMLANFIATSITYKKQEIGILRAIGSRGNDVFRIFFSESFIIASINFLLSATGVGIATAIINSVIRKRLGVLITILGFGVRQIVLLMLVSILVAFISSYLPVKKIASKRPIDAIRNR